MKIKNNALTVKLVKKSVITSDVSAELTAAAIIQERFITNVNAIGKANDLVLDPVLAFTKSPDKEVR